MSGEIIIYEPQPSSLEDIALHVQRRSSLFISRLQDAANGVNEVKKRIKRPLVGFQKISIDPDSGLIVKVRGDDPSAFFTGLSFCELASLALRDGLRHFVYDSRFQFDVCDLWTYEDAENWDVRFRRGGELHSITRAVDKRDSNNRVLYSDPTYAQVNYRYAGQIVPLWHDELDQFYSSTIEPTTNHTDINYLLPKVERNRFTRKVYESLVASVC